MQFQVPQFIEVEDKIFGPLTLAQFIYIAGGAGCAFILYAFLPLWLAVILAIPVLALAFSLAFYRVNNRPFVYVLEAAFTYVTRDKLYLWRKAAQDAAPSASQKSAGPLLAIPGSGRRIADLSRNLEAEAIRPPHNPEL
jgi:hypothetical protein